MIQINLIVIGNIILFIGAIFSIIILLVLVVRRQLELIHDENKRQIENIGEMSLVTELVKYDAIHEKEISNVRCNNGVYETFVKVKYDSKSNKTSVEAGNIFMIMYNLIVIYVLNSMTIKSRQNAKDTK